MASKTSAYSPTPAAVNYTIELDDVRMTQAGGFPSTFITRANLSNASLEVNIVGPSAAFVAGNSPQTTVTFIFESLGGAADYSIAAPVAALNLTNQTFSAPIPALGFPAAGLYKVLATISVGQGAASFGNGYVESGVIEVR